MVAVTLVVGACSAILICMSEKMHLRRAVFLSLIFFKSPLKSAIVLLRLATTARRSDWPDKGIDGWIDRWMDADGEVVTPKLMLAEGVVVVNGEFTDSDVKSVILHSIGQQSNLNFTGVLVVSIVGRSRRLPRVGCWLLLVLFWWISVSFQKKTLKTTEKVICTRIRVLSWCIQKCFY